MLALTLHLPVLLLAFVSLASADLEPTEEQWCSYACEQAVGENSWAGLPNATEDYWGASCQNVLQVSSFWACNRKYCTPAQIEAGTWLKQSYCQTYGNTDLLPISIIANLTDEDISSLPILEFKGADIVNETSLPDQYTFDRAYRSGAEWFIAQEHHHSYSNACFIFWGIVIGIGILHNLYYHFGPKMPDTILLRWWTTAYSYLVTRPVTGCEADGSKPPLLESIVSGIFVIVNVVLGGVHHTTFDENIFWANTAQAIWRYVADRTAHMAYANLVIFWLFGIRNDLLIQATGWQFATFSRFHRVVAFVATVQAIVHSAGYSFYSYVDGGNAAYLENFAYEYWNVGVAATTTMTFAIILSISWFRVRWYDLFLVVHIVLALVTLVMLFYHTKIFDGEYDGYLWPCVAFWAFDRAVRYGRIMWNLILAKSPKCLVEYDQEADLVRVDVSDALTRWGRDSNGAHYYMYLIRSIRFWESHPFTLVRYQETEEASATPRWKYSLLIRPYDGFTRTLASRSIRGPVVKSCLFEGPYGSAPSLHKARGIHKDLTSMVYIMGGSGISVAISSIYRILETRPDMKITLIWAVRSHAFLTSILERELRNAKDKIIIRAFVTRENTADLDTVEAKDLAIELVTSKSEGDEDSVVNLSYGRPDVQQIVIDAASERQQKIGLVVCGPVRMTSDVRSAAMKANKGGNERVRLFAEDFSW